MRYILSIDLGSSGPKVALVSSDGRIAARAVRAVETLGVGAGGFEQDPDAIWRAVIGACKEVLGAAGIPADRIVGVVCDSNYFSIIPVDRDGRALMNCIMWMDQRGGPHAIEFYGREPDAMERWIERHGMPPMPSGNDSLSHIWFIQKERPDIYEHTHAFVEPMDYLIARFTGIVAANACTVFPLLLTDNRDVSSIDYDAGLIETAGIDSEKLPPLRPVSGCVSTLLPDIAEELGLGRNTKVYAGMNDTQAVAVGIGTFRPGVGGVNVGTTTQILADVDATRTDTVNAILGMPSAIPGRYTAMAENGLGGKLLEHFVLGIIFSRDAFADHSTEDAYSHIEEIVAAEAAGSGGLLFLPWLGGSQSPIVDPDVRGGFLNMSLGTTRTQMLRAIIEGVSFNMRWTLPAVEKFCGQRFEELHFSGGGATSDVWSQIMADVMARPILQVEDARYLNSRASAFLGFHQAEMVGLDEIEKFCPIKKRYEPDAERVDLYEGLFEQFLAAFEQNRPIFQKLNGGG